MKKTRWLTILLLLIAGSTLTSPATSRLQETPSTAGSTLKMNFMVVDKSGNPVDAINKNDIQLQENGVEQKILSIEVDQRPIDYVLAIDTSGSFRKLLQASIDAMSVIILNRRDEDEIAIERFISNDQIEKVHDFSTDANSLTKALQTLTVAGGQSAVIDALCVAVNFVGSHHQSEDRRKAVVMISDGEDRNSYYKTKDLIKLLRQQGVQVFIIGITFELDKQEFQSRRNSKERAEELLKSVARESGGRAFFVKDKPELLSAVTQIVRDLRGQFRLSFAPTFTIAPNDAKEKQTDFVEINISLGESQKALSVVSQRGYYRLKAARAKN